MHTLIETMATNFEWVLLIFIVLGLAVSSFELLYEIFTRKTSWPRTKEILSSVFVALPQSLTEAFTGAWAMLMALAIYQWVDWRIELNWFSFFLVVLFVDIVHYWTHRWEHHIRILWAFHSVHHSSPVFNYSTSFRVAFMRNFFDIFYYLPVVAIGVHPLWVFSALYLVAIYQIWLHSDIIGKLGPIEWIFNTPSHHRVHHGCDDKYIDKNFSGIFIVWDKIWGTFQVEEEKPVYGLVTPLNSVNPLLVHFNEYINIFHDLKSTTNFNDKLGYLFCRPGWRPGRTPARTPTRKK